MWDCLHCLVTVAHCLRFDRESRSLRCYKMTGMAELKKTKQKPNCLKLNVILVSKERIKIKMDFRFVCPRRGKKKPIIWELSSGQNSSESHFLFSQQVLGWESPMWGCVEACDPVQLLGKGNTTEGVCYFGMKLIPVCMYLHSSFPPFKYNADLFCFETGSIVMNPSSILLPPPEGQDYRWSHNIQFCVVLGMEHCANWATSPVLTVSFLIHCIFSRSSNMTIFF